MRFFKSFIFLLIGMISLTVTGASFTNPEQKQKTEIADSFESQTINAVEVTANYDFSLQAFEKMYFIFENSKSRSDLKAKVKTFDASMPLLDNKHIYKWQELFYKEKLNKNLRLKVLENQEILKFPVCLN